MSSHLIIATHGNAGIELLKTTEMIAGPQENIRAISFLEGETVESLQSKFETVVESLNATTDSLIVFVDILGGSPFNVSTYLGYSVLTGVNVPMILEFTTLSQSMDNNDSIEHLITTGRESITQLNTTGIADEDEEF